MMSSTPSPLMSAIDGLLITGSENVSSTSALGPYLSSVDDITCVLKLYEPSPSMTIMFPPMPAFTTSSSPSPLKSAQAGELGLPRPTYGKISSGMKPNTSVGQPSGNG